MSNLLGFYLPEVTKAEFDRQISVLEPVREEHTRRLFESGIVQAVMSCGSVANEH